MLIIESILFDLFDKIKKYKSCFYMEEEFKKFERINQAYFLRGCVGIGYIALPNSLFRLNCENCSEKKCSELTHEFSQAKKLLRKC